jgi:hypothetical protein
MVETRSATKQRTGGATPSGTPTTKRTPARGKKAHAHSGPEYEFMGPYIGPIGIIIGLPLVCYLLHLTCNANGCVAVYPKLTVPQVDLAKYTFFTWEAVAVFFGYFALQVRLRKERGAARRSALPPSPFSIAALESMPLPPPPFHTDVL